MVTSTTVTSIDTKAKHIERAAGGRLSYDQFLLTTGATPRHVAIPRAELAGIHYLRSLSSCDTLRDALGRATRLVVVGAGWIGSEVAASARPPGEEVALIEAGVPVAGMNINVWDVAHPIRALVAFKPVDPARPPDPGIDLSSV